MREYDQIVLFWIKINRIVITTIWFNINYSISANIFLLNKVILGEMKEDGY